MERVNLQHSYLLPSEIRSRTCVVRLHAFAARSSTGVPVMLYVNAYLNCDVGGACLVCFCISCAEYKIIGL